MNFSLVKLSRFLILGLTLFSCTSRSPSVISQVLPQLIDERPAIIFLHGFYGAALRKEGRGDRVFLTGMEAMFGTSALSLFQKELGTPVGPPLEVEGLLGTVPVIPGLYEVDVYSSFVRRLRSTHPSSQILPFVYDWRQDLYPNVSRLDELVRTLKEKNVPSITIIAHSMGGQIAAYYLGYGNQPLEHAKLDWAGAMKVQKAVFMGVPFSGSMIALRCFEKGSGLYKSDRLMPSETMASFPSLYQLLPTNSKGILDAKGKPLDIDLFNSTHWQKNNFALYRRKNLSPEILAARDKFVINNLASTKLWSEAIQLGRTNAWSPPAPFKALNIVGTGRDTLDGGYVNGKDGALVFDPEDLQAANLPASQIMSNGDTTVTTTSSAVPQALEAVTKVIMTKASHDKLFQDSEVESELTDFLTQ